VQLSDFGCFLYMLLCTLPILYSRRSFLDKSYNAQCTRDLCEFIVSLLVQVQSHRLQWCSVEKQEQRCLCVMRG